VRAVGGKPNLQIYTKLDTEQIPQLAVLGARAVRDMQIVAKVFPFRVNAYVVNELIDWDAVPDDPIFRMVFPDREMLDEDSFAKVVRAVESDDCRTDVQQVVSEIRAKLNPHPGEQLSLNRPVLGTEQISGLQHKYHETLLFFPSDGQTCHSYCTFCFRWPQFVGDKSLRIAMSDRDTLVEYIGSHPEITDLLITGGDAFTIKARRLRFFLEPLVESRFRHLTSIRFGTKALSFWPYRFITDPDADELIEVIRWLVSQGKHVSIMAHYNHGRELSTAAAEEAIQRLRSTGAVIRSQGPLLRRINDDASVWATLWRRQVNLGIVPYYMFVARDTGPKWYFDVPLARAWKIYAEAARQVSGLGRTARGPSMSTSPGKIEVIGVSEVAGERVFVLRFLQSRDPALSFRPFFARYDETACWLDELRPAFGEPAFFFDSKASAGVS
jgi:KamA family protein